MAAWNFAESRGGRRNRLLASTAVAGGILAALSANPQSAFAACSAAGTGSGTVTINCGTTATTDASTFNADTPGADTRTWRYLTDQINATISGNITNYGLEFSNSFVGANAAINVVHNGTINQPLAPTVPANSNSLAALSIFASRAITYTGAGTITTNVPGADGLLALVPAPRATSVSPRDRSSRPASRSTRFKRTRPRPEIFRSTSMARSRPRQPTA